MKELRSSLPLFLIMAIQFLLKHTDLLVVWIVVYAWESQTGKTLSSESKWTLYFGAFAVTSFRAWRKEALRVRAAETTLAEERTKSNPVRVFVKNPDALLERYQQTGTLAEKLLTPYLDQWIRSSGRFEGATDSLVGEAIFVSLILENGRRIQLRFSADEGKRIRLLREGQHVTAVCQVRHGYGAGVFALENCELIGAEPCRPFLSRVS